MRAVDVARGTAWGLAAGVAYSVLAAAVLALPQPDAGPAELLTAVAVTLALAAAAAGAAGLVLGTLTAVLALALAPHLRPAVGGPLCAAVLWTLPWVVSGQVDPREDVGAALLLYAAPLVLGALAARRWAGGVPG